MNTKTSFRKKLPAFAGVRNGKKAESLTSPAWGNALRNGIWGNALRNNKLVIKVVNNI